MSTIVGNLGRQCFTTFNRMHIACAVLLLAPASNYQLHSGSGMIIKNNKTLLSFQYSFSTFHC